MNHKKMAVIGITCLLFIASIIYVRSALVVTAPPKIEFDIPDLGIDTIKKNTDMLTKKDPGQDLESKPKTSTEIAIEAARAKSLSDVAAREHERELEKLRRSADDAQKQANKLAQQLEAERSRNKAADDLRVAQSIKQKEQKALEVAAQTEIEKAAHLDKLRAALKEGELLITVVIRNKAVTSVEEKFAEFKLDGRTYVPVRTQVAVLTKEDVLSYQNRWVTPRADGTFEFTVTTRSTAPGIAFRIDKGTKFSADARSSCPGFVEAYAPFDTEGWVKAPAPAADLAALRKASEKKIEDLINQAIPQYYTFLVTEYPKKAAKKAADSVGGGTVIYDALCSRFKILGKKHVVPDTKLDRELGTKATMAFRKVFETAQAKYFEELPTTSVYSAAAVAANDSERIKDLLVKLKTPQQNNAVTSDSSILEVLVEK